MLPIWMLELLAHCASLVLHIWPSGPPTLSEKQILCRNPKGIRNTWLPDDIENMVAHLRI